MLLCMFASTTLATSGKIFHEGDPVQIKSGGKWCEAVILTVNEDLPDRGRYTCRYTKDTRLHKSGDKTRKSGDKIRHLLKSIAEKMPTDEKKLWFSPKKLIGVYEINGVVRAVYRNTQAKRKGVKQGWQILKVNGERYTHGLYQQAMKQEKRFSLTFLTTAEVRPSKSKKGKRMYILYPTADRKLVKLTKAFTFGGKVYAKDLVGQLLGYSYGRSCTKYTIKFDIGTVSLKEHYVVELPEVSEDKSSKQSAPEEDDQCATMGNELRKALNQTSLRNTTPKTDNGPDIARQYSSNFVPPVRSGSFELSDSESEAPSPLAILESPVRNPTLNDHEVEQKVTEEVPAVNEISSVTKPNARSGKVGELKMWFNEGAPDGQFDKYKKGNDE